MYRIPYGMRTNWSYECPLTGKAFDFTRATKREAFVAQQAHTAGEIRRLEQLAGRELTYRELMRAGWMERQAAAVAKAAEAKAVEETAKKPQEPDPFVTAILGPDIR